jgi:putative tricarboxylic transport membrane protein
VKWSRVGASIAALAAIYVFEALEFETSFIADPIGPRAFPVGIGLLTLLAGSGLFFTEKPGARERMDAAARLRAAALAATLLAYALLLEALGFIAATTPVMMIAVVLFRGRLLSGLLGGLVTAIAIYYLFGYGLSIPLPLGRIFSGS